MANEPKYEGASDSEKQAKAAAAETDRTPLIRTAIVIKRDKKRGRKKKRYTRGTKDTQRFLFGASKAGYRVANSFRDGMDTFVDRSDKSRERRRDGFIRDSLRNASRGFSDGFRELGKAPEEIADRISTRRVWRTFRVFTPFFGR